MRFAITGVSGFVAPRHLEAIRHIGGRVVAALDPHDAVGVLDRYDYDIRFFRNEWSFWRCLNENPVDWLVVCAPNYEHADHIRKGIESGASVLCEKPLIIDPRQWNYLQLIETPETKIRTVLQLRLIPELIALRESLHAEDANTPKHRVQMSYYTPRGRWYETSWKSDPDRSGGLAFNIGIHLFDLMLWLFGPAENSLVTSSGPTRMAGTLVLERAVVDWDLSIDPIPGRPRPDRVLRVDGKDFTFSDITNLHTRLYEETILRGRGFDMFDAWPAISLVHSMCGK